MATITKRNYVALATVQVTVASAVLADVDLAEQLIDSYIGFQDKHIQTEYFGEITALSNSDKTIADTSSNSQLNFLDNYYKNCVIEIIGGTGAGQLAFIESSSKDDKTITITDAFDTTPDTTSVFKIYQFAKFPRWKDVTTSPDGLKYYKSIPQAIKDAVIAQVQFQDEMGDAFFEGDDSDKESERIGNYSYSRGSAGASASVKFVSPKARTLLRGIKNSLGRLVPPNPTEL